MNTLILWSAEKRTARETIRQDLERASDKYDVSKAEQFSVGDETQEDNDTSVQSQKQAMRAALCEP